MTLDQADPRALLELEAAGYDVSTIEAAGAAAMAYLDASAQVAARWLAGRRGNDLVEAPA